MSEDELFLKRLPEPLPEDPLAILAGWLAHAIALGHTPNPNAMTLATVDTNGSRPDPDARIVLCKDLDTQAGRVVFFTNYHSAKGRQLEKLARAVAVFHWDHLDLQARLRGPVTRTPAAESDSYFSSRPLLSRLSAWASKQSQPVKDRAVLRQQLEDIKARFGVTDPLDPTQEKPIPRPAHWGGFQLWAEEVELWIGQRGRLHERARWRRSLQPDNDEFVAGSWQVRRLQP